MDSSYSNSRLASCFLGNFCLILFLNFIECILVCQIFLILFVIFLDKFINNLTFL